MSMRAVPVIICKIVNLILTPPPPPPNGIYFNPGPRDILVIVPSIDPFGLHPPAHVINQNLHSDPHGHFIN
jgi:hypothetical protein